MVTSKSTFNFDRYTSRSLHGYHEEPTRRIPIVGDVDVLVAGGSPSGTAAAICAARHGVTVSLVERYGFLGGQSVYSSVVQWEKRAFINNLGAVATRGIAEEMVERIVARGGSDGLWTTPPGCEEMRDGEEWLNVEAMILTLIEMCEEAGVEILFHTMATDVILERGNPLLPRMTGVVFENKAGRFAITANVVIDATADLDLVWRAMGEEGCGMRDPTERMAGGFYVWFGGINNEAFADYLLTSPPVIGYPDPVAYPEKLVQHLSENMLVYARGFQDILDEAEVLGLLGRVQEALLEVGARPLGRIGMKSVGHGRWCCAFTALRNLNLLDTWEVTKYEILRIKVTSMMLPIMRLIPGWGKCYIARTNLHVGGRESRYLKAVKMLQEKDMFLPENDSGLTPLDTVGRSGAHDPGKNKLQVAYPIPYGMIVPEKLNGVLCCTRAVGAKSPVALNAHRGIVPTIVVGQAAGTAAALAAKTGVEPRDVSLEDLQNALRQDNVVLDEERVDFEIPSQR